MSDRDAVISDREAEIIEKEEELQAARKELRQKDTTLRTAQVTLQVETTYINAAIILIIAWGLIRVYLIVMWEEVTFLSITCV